MNLAVPQTLFTDALRQGIDLPLTEICYPLGYPFRIETNSEAIRKCIKERWKTFLKEFDTPPIRARIVVAEDQSVALPPPPLYRAQRHLLSIISDSANFTICDLENAFAYCWLGSAAATDTTFARYYFLDSIVYLTLWQHYLTPIHAACVALDGHGVLLCGESGAGKTTLAYTCARAGWTFLSDDVSPLVRGNHDRHIRGTPHLMRFTDTAAKLLPELKGWPAGRRLDGKPSVEVRTADIPGIATAFGCRADHIVFLNRTNSGRPRLVPVDRDEALSRLLQSLPLYEERISQEVVASLQHLLDLGAVELRYRDADPAVKRLESLVREGN